MRTTLTIIIILFFTNSICKSGIEDYFDSEFMNSDYMDMCIDDDNHAFICGYYGAVIMSEDKGNTWTKCPITPNNAFLMSIDAKENTVIAVGFDGVIVYSNDGGKSWNTPDSVTSESLRSVVLIDSQTGVAFGNFGTIIKTTDGGKSWREIISGISDYIYTAVVTDTESIIIATNEGNIFKSIDYGESWTKSDIPYLTFNISNSFSYSLDKSIYLLTEYKMLKSTDDGNSWSVLNKPYPKSNYCFYTQNCNGYHIGDWLRLKIMKVENDTTIVDSTNLGKSIEPTQITHLKRIAFFDENNGIAVGSKNFISRTTNGGKSWNLESYLNSFMDDPAHVYTFGDIFFLNDTIGFIGSYFENIFKTTNGGATWKYIEKDESRGGYNHISQMYFFNENKALMRSSASTNRTLLTTCDGGRTVKRDTVRELNGAPPIFHHIENDTFFIRGWRWFYNTYHSYYGFRNFEGQYWNVGVFDSASLGCPYFVNRSNIFMCGSFIDSSLLPEEPDIYYRGFLVHSKDSGKTWSRTFFNTLQVVNSLLFIDENLGYAFGMTSLYGPEENTIVFKTTDGGNDWAVIDTNIIRITATLKPPNDRFCFGSDRGNPVFSADGGQNWEGWIVPEGLHILKIYTTVNYAYMTGRATDSYTFVFRYKLKDEYMPVKDYEIQTRPAPLAYISIPFPNPIKNYVNFNIVWDRKYDFDDLKINVYNLNGEKINNPILEFNSKTINTGILTWYPEGLPAGIYFVELEVNKYKRASKVMIY
jgi:photosystem II stability/assembly factor-like uncharacterized protein